ncbi:hypothetical protein AB0M02_13915 [Actinoplanes sp. NPDC051861]|uniref:hypothetical protein n=1 Tax=Actinoplanes sp. NPDC051861 TaxID=3155170 RepID=UPI00341713E2
MTTTALSPDVRTPPPRTAHPGWGITAASLSLLIVTALWVSNGGPSGGITGIGRLTGLYASNLLLLQVLLMARIPLVERAFGHDRLAH